MFSFAIVSIRRRRLFNSSLSRINDTFFVRSFSLEKCVHTISHVPNSCCDLLFHYYSCETKTVYKA